MPSADPARKGPDEGIQESRTRVCGTLRGKALLAIVVDPLLVPGNRISGSRLHMNTRGDWARSPLLWAARHLTGMTLREIGAAAGGMDYTAVAMAVKRFETEAGRDNKLSGMMQKVREAVM